MEASAGGRRVSDAFGGCLRVVRAAAQRKSAKSRREAVGRTGILGVLCNTNAGSGYQNGEGYDDDVPSASHAVSSC